MGVFFIALAVLIGVVFLLFFPIYIEGNIQYQLRDKKFAFSIYLYKRIKLLGGYVEDYPGGFALHTSKNSVKLFPLNDKEGRKKRISIFRHFKLSALALTTEISAKYLPLMMIMHTFLKVYFLQQGGKIEEYSSQIWLKNVDILTITANSVAKVNLYMQLCALVHLWKEKIKNAR